MPYPACTSYTPRPAPHVHRRLDPRPAMQQQNKCCPEVNLYCDVNSVINGNKNVCQPMPGPSCPISDKNPYPGESNRICFPQQSPTPAYCVPPVVPTGDQRCQASEAGRQAVDCVRLILYVRACVHACGCIFACAAVLQCIYCAHVLLLVYCSALQFNN